MLRPFSMCLIKNIKDLETQQQTTQTNIQVIFKSINVCPTSKFRLVQWNRTLLHSTAVQLVYLYSQAPWQFSLLPVSHNMANVLVGLCMRRRLCLQIPAWTGWMVSAASAQPCCAAWAHFCDLFATLTGFVCCSVMGPCRDAAGRLRFRAGLICLKAPRELQKHTNQLQIKASDNI